MLGEITPLRLLALWLYFASPVLFCASGCQWRPNAPSAPGVQHVKTSDFVRPVVVAPAPPPKVNPLPNRSPLCECKSCVCENCLCGTIPQDPRAVPVPDKSLPPGFTPTKNKAFVEPVPPKPLTEQQKALLRPTYQSNESYSEPRRGLFRRWRGGSTSTGASASGSC